jgi:tRNA threonylcarbamoyladenosine biosynthesis protein TsaB
MLILALDTSGDMCTAALVNDERLVGQVVFKHKMDLLQRLAPNIKWVLEDCGVSVEQLDAVAVSTGPGSFTGIRIGVTTAKSMAYATGKKLIGVPTLDLLAAGVTAEHSDVIAPLISARPGEVYTALYRVDNGCPHKLTDDLVLPIKELLDKALGLKSQRVIFCGSGCRANKSTIEDFLADKAILVPTWMDYPRGEIIGKLAIDRLAAGESDDTFSLVPLYVQRPTPEIRLEALREAKTGK